MRLFRFIPGHSLGKGSYLSAEMQLVYSTAPADWANDIVVNSNFSQFQADTREKDINLVTHQAMG